LEIFSLRANIFRVADSSYERIPRSLRWFFVGVIEGCTEALHVGVSLRSGFFRISRLFPRWFDDIDISKIIHPAQFQQPSTFPLLATSVQDGALRHGRDPLHGNGALRSLKAEH
jgi:hypothetical protein